MATKQVLMMLGFAFVAPAVLHASLEAVWAEFGASPGMAHEATLIVCVAYAAVAVALAGAAMRGLLGRLECRIALDRVSHPDEAQA
jgi:hypothetical protein